MGTVYRATDSRLGREVAIKVLTQPGASDKVLLERFFREAKAAASIDHPHLVTVHEIDEHDGNVFLVLEYVRGGSVGDLIRAKGRLDWHSATRLAIEACHALAACHARDIFHRDIKPTNLLLRDRDAYGLKLSDFGLAKWRAEATTLTAPRDLLGTPDFMSPEQCRAEPVDARSDIYSLGATYYAMLTGRPPFQGDVPMQVMFAHCATPVPDPRKLAPDIPAGCQAIVRRAMAKEPRNRYASVSEMHRDLEQLLDVETPRVQPVTRVRVPPWSRVWLAGVAAAVLVAIGLWRGAGSGRTVTSVASGTAPSVQANEAPSKGIDGDPSAGTWSFRATPLPSGAPRGMVADGEVRALAMSPDLTWLVWGAGAKGPPLAAVPWPECSSVLLGQRIASLDTVSALCFTSKGVVLVATENVLMAVNLDLREGWRLGRTGDGTIRALAVIERDGTTLVAVAMQRWDGTGCVDGYSIELGAEPRLVGSPIRIAESDAPVKSLTFSVDNRWLAGGTGAGEALVWRTADWREAARCVAASPGADPTWLGYALAISPDSRWLLAAGGPEVLRWPLGEPGTPSVVRRHTAPVTVLRFSPDGRALASGATDGLLLGRYDSPEGPLRSFRGHDSLVTGIVFAGADTLISAGLDKQIRVHALSD
jgi:serine/threonine protein kinase